MAASLSAIVAALTRETMRKVAISTFICVHLLALAWWNFGVIDYRPPDGWSQLRAGADAVDRRGRIRAGLETYMRAMGLWQRWVMFGPDVPHQTARVEVHGITGFDAQGRPILDPELLYTSDDAPITAINQMIGNPPCGWDRGANPKSVYLRGAFAQHRAAEVGEARGVAYVGVQLLCVLRDLEPPGELPPEDPDALAWRIEPLWAGPVVTTRGGPR